MKCNKAVFSILLVVAGLFSIATLSSFYKSCGNEACATEYPTEQSEYKSQQKESVTRGNITLSSSFENDYYTNSHRTGHYYVEVQSEKSTRRNARRTPLNISVVIDRSGSMAGDKIRNAKKAAKYLVDELSSEDYLSLVIYDSQVDVLLHSTQVNNKQYIKNLIDKIQDRGGTNLMGGAMKGYDEVKKTYSSGYINRVLLLSDGLANEGITDPSRIQRIVRDMNNQEGISISTFGVGNDYNEDLMTDIAESGTGNYYFISDAEKIASIFRKELNGLMEVVAQNTELRITLPDNVNVDKVYGARHTQVGRNLNIKFHDISSEETKGVLIRYTVDRNTNTPIRFATSISYYDTERESNEKLSLSNRCEYTSSSSTYNEYFNEWVSAQVALYESNEKMDIAMKEVDKGNYDEARKIVRENKEYIKKKAPLVSKSVELQRAAAANVSYEKNIEDAESMPASELKHMQKASKSENYQLRAKKK